MRITAQTTLNIREEVKRMVMKPYRDKSSFTEKNRTPVFQTAWTDILKILFKSQ